MSAARFQRMVNRESGLLGASGASSDLRDLLAGEVRGVRAAGAVALFCYQAKKWIGWVPPMNPAQRGSYAIG